MTAERPPADMRLGNEARKALAAMRRWERKSEEAAQAAALARDELTALHRKACDRFDRQVPADALLLDVLELIDVDGDRWLWRGLRNNKNVATVRLNRQELSLVRYLAIEFGVINPDDFGALYPADGDADDVNPWHRVLRRSEHPTGNPTRFGFRVEDKATAP